MSEPIAYAGPWRRVMEAAGYRCECTGQCGNAHAKSQGRCPRGHDQHASKHRGPIHLLAAPAHLATRTRTTAADSSAPLSAWCPDCHDGAQRAATRATRTRPNPGQGGLFEFD